MLPDGLVKNFFRGHLHRQPRQPLLSDSLADSCLVHVA